MTMKSQETKVVLIYLVSNNIQSLFDCPVVNNFHKRQEDLADILDEVRQSMYDVKMESKSLITFSIVENLLTSKEDDHQKSSNTPTKSNQQSKTPQLTKTKSKGDFNKTSSNFKENGLKTPKPNRNRKSEDTIDVQAYKTEAGKNTRPTTTVTNKSKPTKNEAKSEETKHRSIKKETHSKEKVSNIANNANSNNGAKVKKPITSTAPRVKSKDLKEEEKHGSTENNEEAKEELKTKEETTVAKKNIPAKKEEKKSLKPIKKEESKKEVKKPKESIKSPAKNTKNPKVDKPKDNKESENKVNTEETKSDPKLDSENVAKDEAHLDDASDKISPNENGKENTEIQEIQEIPVTETKGDKEDVNNVESHDVIADDIKPTENLAEEIKAE